MLKIKMIIPKGDSVIGIGLSDTEDLRVSV